MKQLQRNKWLTMPLCAVLALQLAGCGAKQTQAEPQTQAQQPAAVIATEEQTQQIVETADLPVDFAVWQEVNSDIFGWIEVPDTNISYPTVQNAEDDTYYLTHHFDGTYNSFGSIFSEATYNHAGFTDRVTTLYGHDIWTAGLYFHELHKFSEDDFFDSHDEVYTYTPDEKQTWQIISWVTMDDRHLMYAFLDFTASEDVDNFFNETNAMAETKLKEDAFARCDENSQYLFLSTCHPTISDQRCILVCRLASTQPAQYNGGGIAPEDITQ